MTKEELRKQLQEQFEQHLQVNPDAVTLYAAVPEPETKPWKKKPSLLDQAFARLADNALEQPRVWVHRDYHSRNLMVTTPDNPGVLDFQDAVVGAVTYDLVSLLRDCYIAWPRSEVESWALAHRARLRALGMSGLDDAGQFLRWFDLMGAQRHLKAIGIFARLKLRDGKSGYLDDIPRTLGYLLDVAARYPDLAGLRALLRARGVDQWTPPA